MDNFERIWASFIDERNTPLRNRFSGLYRAVVVETNDPLQMHRVRIKCPELHDSDLKREDCPWAVQMPQFGGKNAGSWFSPCIGDIVFIAFEKNHAYSPILVGAADPTRTMMYPLQSIYTKSPLALKLDESPDKVPDDFEDDKLPKDFRPMSGGWQDRYGNSEVNSAVGFFPVEHSVKPASPGYDAIANEEFLTSYYGKKPLVNNPDMKYMYRMTKYGILMIQSDMGYEWKKDGDYGEFEGDFEKDREFEIERYKQLSELISYPLIGDEDQRRFEVRTRAGHKFEMRDVGWAQSGGGMSGNERLKETKCRSTDPAGARILSKHWLSDKRWIKFRTKGGHIIQMMDAGFHPEEDEYYKRAPRKDDQISIDELSWDARDSRQIRLITRWGTKLVLDDRGSDPRDATEKELPRANGWLLKTRRSWGESLNLGPLDNSDPKWTNSGETGLGGVSRGFAFEANDKDELNTSRWYSPKSKIIEMNDKHGYCIMCTDTGHEISRPWEGVLENEFATRIAMTENPEENTYHLKLDRKSGYLRCKTAAGRDEFRSSDLKDVEPGLNQGIEARDGRIGKDGAWTELVDMEHRGIWLSKKSKLGIWRSKDEKDQFIMIDDGNDRVIIHNNENGPIQVFCKGNIELLSEGNIAMEAERISMKANQDITFEANGAHMKLDSSSLGLDVAVNASVFNKSPESNFDVIDLDKVEQEKREPDDRGYSEGIYNEIKQSIIAGSSSDIGEEAEAAAEEEPAAAEEPAAEEPAAEEPNPLQNVIDEIDAINEEINKTENPDIDKIIQDHLDQAVDLPDLGPAIENLNQEIQDVVDLPDLGPAMENLDQEIQNIVDQAANRGQDDPDEDNNKLGIIKDKE